jgi:hypothetical protein
MNKMTNLDRHAISNPNTWTKKELYINLQAAVDVELWTIPLYLTSLYSIKVLDKGDQAKYPYIAKLIESVVIEEMLHLQLISNVCNALGYTPQMNIPTYNQAEGIPFISRSVPPLYQSYQVQLGGLNKNQMQLFCVIELPEPKTAPDWSTQIKYNSIGELYQALEIAVNAQWDSLYVGDENNTKQQANFGDFIDKYKTGKGFSQVVNSLDSALTAMKVIVDQGEGSEAIGEVPDEFQAPAQSTDPSDYDPDSFDPSESHFQKFHQALLLVISEKNIPTCFPLILHPDKDQLAKQANAVHRLHQSFKAFIGDLQTGFSTPSAKQKLPGTFFTNMFAMQQDITKVWRTGAVPSFS